MLQTLHHRARLVALEAHLTDDVVGLVRGITSDIHDSFGDFVARFAPNLPGLQFSGRAGGFLREVPKHNYVQVRPLLCFVPAGLKSTYMEYLQPLSQAVAHATSAQEKVLNPYTTFLASMVSNHDAAISAVDITRGYAALQEEREALNKQLGKCFTPGGQQSQRTLGDVVARNGDWSLVLNQTDALVQAVNRADRKALDKKLHECVELLEILKRKLERKDFGDISAQVATNLAAGAYQSALELEFFSVTYYRVQALAEAVNKTVEHLSAVFAGKN